MEKTMNLAHVHLLLNHLPPLGVLFGFLLLAAGLLRKSGDLVRASLVTFVLVALLAIPTYYTGGPAEKIVEGMPGVSEMAIMDHEESAEASFVAALVLGALSCFKLFFYRKRETPRSIAIATLVLALVVTGMMAWTAHLGGKIHHGEIRGEAAVTSPPEKD
jgi:hypothetical protein